MTTHDERFNVERNPDGTIKTRTLDSETAKEMGAKGGYARSKTRTQMDADRDSLLIEAGFSDPSEAPTHLKLLAENAVQGKVQAIVQFVRETRPKEYHAPPESTQPRPMNILELLGELKKAEETSSTFEGDQPEESTQSV